MIFLFQVSWFYNKERRFLATMSHILLWIDPFFLKLLWFFAFFLQVRPSILRVLPFYFQIRIKTLLLLRRFLDHTFNKKSKSFLRFFQSLNIEHLFQYVRKNLLTLLLQFVFLFFSWFINQKDKSRNFRFYEFSSCRFFHDSSFSAFLFRDSCLAKISSFKSLNFL